MAARTSGGGADPGGSSRLSGGGEGQSSGGGGGGPLQSDNSRSPAHSASAAFARAVLASPAKTSHRWGCAFGGVDLDDEIWDIRFNFPGEDNLERTISRSDITVSNLMALIEGHGYGFLDTMYYVKEKGKGVAGMVAVNNMAKVQEMLEFFEKDRELTLTVIRQNAAIPAGLNKEDLEVEFPVDKLPVISVDNYGVSYISQDEEEEEELEEIYPVAVDYSEVLYVGTQQSCNVDKGKQVVPYVDLPVDVIDTDDEIFGPLNMGQYQPADHCKAVAAELELVRKLKRQREEEAPTPEDLEIQEQLSQQKKQRLDPEMHIEGDTDVEEVFEDEEEHSDPDELNEGDDISFAKIQVTNPGPTSRAHHEAEQEEFFNFVPSDEEELSPDDVQSSDDDGFVKKFVLPGGGKRRRKKMQKRVWYDESRADAHEQFALKLCFRDVYQFRVALRNYHIAQLRNYSFHRNTPDRIIVNCSEKDCPFFLTASKIQNERTFCIRKFRALHSCIPHGENTKVSIDWLAVHSEEAVRTDPNTCVDTLIQNAKLKYGVAVPKSKAYRARQKAFSAVIGDQRKQYTRLRDYLQAILDTNPGSRCIVTTKQLVEHPSPNPRFHGLFMCLNASKEGFLNGCRPFIGVDGCFIKLTTGQQILAATGRDGNNNIFPIAFGIVDREDTASWLWFLTQLRYCIGESGKFGNYTIISDRQKGLLKAVSQVFPNSPHRYCLRHIYANFQSAGFRGEELKKHMFAASYSYTKGGFDKAMAAMQKDCEPAYNWLMQIPVEAWARHAFDTNCKTDLVVNNLSEVFNKMILDVRSKPIQTMIDGIKNKLMVKYSATRIKADSTLWEITPYYSEKLEEAKKHSRECTALNADIGLWQVSTTGPGVHAVDLGAKTCGCKYWNLTGIPCNHAISVMRKVKQHPEDYVHDFFKKPMYKEAFKYVIYPVPGADDWPKTNTPDIDPPVFRDKPGRKQTVRRKGAFEVPAPRDTSRMASITCSNCKTQGHRYTSCNVQLRPELQLRKDQHQAKRLNYGAAASTSTTSAGAQYAAASALPAHRAATQATSAAPAHRASTEATSAAPTHRASTEATSAAPTHRASTQATPATSAPPAQRDSAARRASTRTPKITGRMLGYLNAGNAHKYKKN